MPRSDRRHRRLRPAVVAVLLGSGVVPLMEGGPASASSWTVSLAASASDAEVGTTITLTATTNQSLTGTNYFLDIFDQTTGANVGYCSTGSTCQVSHSESQPGSHTYIAYVDADPVFHYPPCCVQATSNTVTVEWHARASAAFGVAFTVEGTLPVFPCPGGCHAGFTGSGMGSGSARAEAAGVEYNATFTVPAGAVSGFADYTEPGPPFCPTIGSAAGTVSLSGSAVGTVYRTSTPTSVGDITGVTFTLSYAYQRAGPAAAIVVTGGTATLSFTFPGTGAGSFVSSVSGAGPGAFEVAPEHAVERCHDPGPLGFTVVGDTALTLT